MRTLRLPLLCFTPMLILIAACSATPSALTNRVGPRPLRCDRLDPSDATAHALLSVARNTSARRQRLDREVWLAFVDAEDNGRLDGWD